jgi:hypothetical protein
VSPLCDRTFSPSHGDDFDAGTTKSFVGKLRLDANTFCRQVSNYSDDDAILNSTIGFPVALRKAILCGVEAILEVLSVPPAGPNLK